MALRNIRVMGDEVLNKTCKEVTEMTPRTKMLIEDMLDTMYEANGVGLAAPQVGILKRIVVIDVTGDEPYVLINPKILETEGEQVVHILVADEKYIATAPAVTAVRTARGLAFIRFEGIHAVAAVARLDSNSYFIGKFSVSHNTTFPYSIPNPQEKSKDFHRGKKINFF